MSKVTLTELRLIGKKKGNIDNYRSMSRNQLMNLTLSTPKLELKI